MKRNGSRRLRQLIMAVLALATTVTVWVFGFSDRTSAGEEKSRSEAAHKPDEVAKSVVTPAMKCSFESGVERGYELQTGANFRAQPMLRKLAGMKPQFVRSKMRVSARFYWRAIRKERSGNWLMAGRLTDLAVSTGKGTNSKSMTSPPVFLFRLAPTCRFVEFGFSQPGSDAPNGLAQRMLMAIEVELPKRGGVRTWTSVHREVGATYLAVNRLVEAGERPRFLKRRSAYLHSKAASDGDPTPKILNSRTEIVLDGQLWLWSLDGRNVVTYGRGGKNGMSATVEMTTRLKPVTIDASPFGSTPFDIAAFTWRSAKDVPEPKRVTAAMRDADKVAALVGVPLEQILSQFGAILRADRSAVGKAAKLLAQYLRANPAQAFALLEHLLAGKIAADLQATVFLGLELAGTVEAHKTLINALSHPDLDAMNRSRAAVALPDIPNPTADTFHALKKASLTRPSETSGGPDFAANSASYALGTLESKVRESQPKLAEMVRDELISRLEGGGPIDDLNGAFGAIGNSGHSDFLEPLEPYLRDPDPWVRAQSYEGLRHMDPALTADLIRELLADETTERGKGKLLTAALDQAQYAKQPPNGTLLSTAIATLGTETDPGVRGLLIRLVGLAAKTTTEARVALIAHFHREKNAGLLVLIGQFVTARELR